MKTNERGFTMIEALVTFTVFVMVMVAVLQLYRSSSDMGRRAENKLELQQNVRLALSYMAREIRMAGYFPENFGSTPPVPPVANPFHVATNSAIAFHGDADGSGASKIFVYCLDGTTLRTQTVAAGALITCANGEAIAENISALQFSYFDEDGTSLPASPVVPYQLDSQAMGSIPDLASTVQRGAVDRVLITLSAESNLVGIGTQTYTLSSDVTVRNGS